jgi:hypothetical protein
MPFFGSSSVLALGVLRHWDFTLLSGLLSHDTLSKNCPLHGNMKQLTGTNAVVFQAYPLTLTGNPWADEQQLQAVYGTVLPCYPSDVTPRYQ